MLRQPRPAPHRFKRLPRNLEGYVDTVPTRCMRCRQGGALDLSFQVAILCKACVLEVLEELGVVIKVNRGKRLACPECKHLMSFTDQVIYANGRIKHSGRCKIHGRREWWLNEGARRNWVRKGGWDEWKHDLEVK